MTETRFRESEAVTTYSRTVTQKKPESPSCRAPIYCTQTIRQRQPIRLQDFCNVCEFLLCIIVNFRGHTAVCKTKDREYSEEPKHKRNKKGIMYYVHQTRYVLKEINLRKTFRYCLCGFVLYFVPGFFVIMTTHYVCSIEREKNRQMFCNCEFYTLCEWTHACFPFDDIC